MRGGCRLLCFRYQPVLVMPLCLVPSVGCAQITACSPPRVLSADGCECVVEQTFTIQVPVTLGADADPLRARVICVK